MKGLIITLCISIAAMTQKIHDKGKLKKCSLIIKISETRNSQQGNTHRKQEDDMRFALSFTPDESSDSDNNATLTLSDPGGGGRFRPPPLVYRELL